MLSSVFFPGGRGASSFRGGVSQLWSWVLLLSTFFFRGRGGKSASSVWLAQRLTHVRKDVVRKRALPGRNFVRKGFCKKAGSARKGFCQEAGSAWKEFCQERFLSGSGLALPGRALELGGGVVVGFFFRGE